MANTWILLRGLGRGSEHWLDFPQALARQCPQDRIVCPDWPGNGSLWEQASPATVEQGVEHYRRCCAELQLSPPYQLVGLSMGGMAALAWLECHPGEVAQAVVINSSVGKQHRWSQRLRPAALLQLLTALGSTQRREATTLRLTSNLLNNPTAVLKQWLEIAARQPVASRNLWRQLLVALRFALERPQHPERITVITSLDDRLVNPRCSIQMARYWGSRLITHPDAGHDLPLDAPKWLAEQLALLSKRAHPLPEEELTPLL